jgi:glutamate dehydrogenase/leucine dehydrogenase
MLATEVPVQSLDVNALSVGRVPVDADHIEILEIRDDAPDEDRRIYSCVALYRKDWRNDWPALGGTRWLQAVGDEVPTPEMARKEAASLALAMFMKNNLIRKAELQLEHREQILFGWQGGKGVIWTPWDKGRDARHNRRYLTPRRLMCHGLLIEQLRGEYIGSKDAGVGGSELRWIERATNFTIGNGCLVDTGDGTAYGVHTGMRTTLEILGKIGSGERKMDGIPVLICGLGKVGFPLMQILQEDGAIVSIWEPALGGTTDADLENFWKKSDDAGAAIEPRHLETLKSLRQSIFRSEDEALGAIPQTRRGIHFVCPAGSRIEWLTDHVNGATRYEILASRSDAAECIVLGPANDQLPLSSDKRSAREAALKRMTEAGVLYVPDPVVSPGGVVAVSHELTAHWKNENVRNDTIHIVDKSVRMLFDLTDDKRSSAAVYRAFETLALE